MRGGGGKRSKGVEGRFTNFKDAKREFLAKLLRLSNGKLKIGLFLASKVVGWVFTNRSNTGCFIMLLAQSAGKTCITRSKSNIKHTVAKYCSAFVLCPEAIKHSIKPLYHNINYKRDFPKKYRLGL